MFRQIQRFFIKMRLHSLHIGRLASEGEAHHCEYRLRVSGAILYRYGQVAKYTSLFQTGNSKAPRQPSARFPTLRLLLAELSTLKLLYLK